ncbi:MAG: hypothetical protein ACKVXR_06700 [Planctomycetota bacterium]
MRAVAGFALTLLSLGSVASAQTVYVPPVDISVLTHQHTHVGGSPPHTYTTDSVDFPCNPGACNGPGFTASIGTGDTIVLRFEAPAGTRFAVHRGPGSTQTLFARARWRTNTTDTNSNVATPSITFENLVGPPPVLALAQNYVSDDGQSVFSLNVFTVPSDFSFTALMVQFTVGHSLAPMSRSYGPVDFGSFGSFHDWYGGGLPDLTVMSIEPISPGLFCSGDGMATPCPCGNSGIPGRGCQNSSATGGARLWGRGMTSPDSMVLYVDGELPSAITIFLQGTQQIQPVVYGDGLRCVHGLLKRLYTKTASGGMTSAPWVNDLSITARSAQMGDPIAPGSTRYYMTYYRDGVAGFCPSPMGSTFNGSNGWAILW